MPLFDYNCGNCGDTFEFLAKNAGAHPESCPCCGKPGKLERMAVQQFAKPSPSSSTPSSAKNKYDSVSLGQLLAAKGYVKTREKKSNGITYAQYDLVNPANN